jgi:hypothetical protein
VRQSATMNTMSKTLGLRGDSFAKSGDIFTTEVKLRYIAAENMIGAVTIKKYLYECQTFLRISREISENILTVRHS